MARAISRVWKCIHVRPDHFCWQTEFTMTAAEFNLTAAQFTVTAAQFTMTAAVFNVTAAVFKGGLKWVRVTLTDRREKG